MLFENMTIGLWIVAFMLVIIVIGLLAFQISMFIHLFFFRKGSFGVGVLWFLLLLSLAPISTILYYVIEFKPKRKRK